jgi:acetoacetyl-CoA synthetase
MRPLWTPDAERIGKAPLTAFLRLAEKAAGRSFAGYADLHRWSIEDRAAFWDLVWDFCDIRGLFALISAPCRRRKTESLGRVF